MVRCRFIFLIVLILNAGKSSAQDLIPSPDSLGKKPLGSFLVFPFFLKSPETDWGFGAASAYFFKPGNTTIDDRTSDLNLVGLYTLREQIVIVLGSTVYFPKEDYILRFLSSFSYYPDKCWGIGNSTPKEAEEPYSLRQFYINPQLLRKFFLNWYAGFTFDYQHIGSFNYKENGVFDQQDIVGRNGGNTSGAGLLLTWDTRNNAYSPSKGFFFELSARAFDNIFGSDFDFSTLSLDFRNFTRISDSQVLALQLVMKNNSGTVPIRNLSMLGGPEIMRGYYNGRYMDMDMFAFQAEFRQFLFWRLGVAGFAGLGEVSDKARNYSWNGLHYSYGAGLRFMVSKSEKLNLRVDYGFGNNSNGLYVILRESF